MLRIALEIDPRSIDIRQKLRELMIESGDRDGAIGETITLAALHIDRGEPQTPSRCFTKCWRSSPSTRRPVEMLAADRSGRPLPGVRDHDHDRHEGALEPRVAPVGFDPEAPLPSYDLEEIGASRAMGSDRPGRFALDVDDPFGISRGGARRLTAELPARAGRAARERRRRGR